MINSIIHNISLLSMFSSTLHYSLSIILHYSPSLRTNFGNSIQDTRQNLKTHWQRREGGKWGERRHAYQPMIWKKDTTTKARQRELWEGNGKGKTRTSQIELVYGKYVLHEKGNPERNNLCITQIKWKKRKEIEEAFKPIGSYLELWRCDKKKKWLEKEKVYTVIEIRKNNLYF